MSLTLARDNLIDLSVQDLGTEIIVSATPDLGDLSPQARRTVVQLPRVDVHYEIYRRGRSEPAAHLHYRQRPGQKLEVYLRAAQGQRPVIETLSQRVVKLLPRWLSPGDSDAALSLLDAELMLGRHGQERYSCEVVLAGDAQHHKAQVLLWARYLGFRHDPARTIRFRRSRKTEQQLTPDTAWQDYLKGAAGKMVPSSSYDPASCRDVMVVDAPDLTCVLRWSGPEYHLQVRGPRERVLDMMNEALEAWRATLARCDANLEARYGYGDLRRLMGV
jgi:hypothetical protein